VDITGIAVLTILVGGGLTFYSLTRLPAFKKVVVVKPRK